MSDQHTVLVAGVPWTPEQAQRAYRTWRFYHRHSRRDGSFDFQAIEAEMDRQRSRLCGLLRSRCDQQKQAQQQEQARAEEGLF